MLSPLQVQAKAPRRLPLKIERSGVCGTCGDYRYLIFALLGPSAFGGKADIANEGVSMAIAVQQCSLGN
jgi:hypothetical protein